MDEKINKTSLIQKINFIIKTLLYVYKILFTRPHDLIF